MPSLSLFLFHLLEEFVNLILSFSSEIFKIILCVIEVLQGQLADLQKLHKCFWFELFILFLRNYRFQQIRQERFKCFNIIGFTYFIDIQIIHIPPIYSWNSTPNSSSNTTCSKCIIARYLLTKHPWRGSSTHWKSRLTHIALKKLWLRICHLSIELAKK